MGNKAIISIDNGKKKKKDQKVIYCHNVPNSKMSGSHELWHKGEKENTVSGKWMIAST